MKTSFIVLVAFFISFSSLAQKPSFKVEVCDSSRSTGFYFLASPTSLMILDNTGNLIYYKPGKQLSNFMLQPNGVMSYYAASKFFLMDSTFNVVDSVACKNVATTNYHDLRILPNGHFLMFGTDSVRMDLSSYSYWKKKYGNDSANVKYAVVQEQDANKNIVFEWRAINHFAIDDVDTFFLHLFPPFDWTHADAVEMDHDGNILLSNRNFNEITKINHKDGSIMWRMGGKKNQFRFINCDVPLYGQSDIRRIANGDITLFDNGSHNVSHGARALEFKLDEVRKTATLQWSYTYKPDMPSNGQGNVQRLNNSNTLVSYGRLSNEDVCFVVVDSTGNKVFRLNAIKVDRVHNYGILPFRLHRPEITCYTSEGVTYLDAGAGHSSYLWSTGVTDQRIPVTKAGSYNVFVPFGEGGYICSENFIVTDVSNTCNLKH